MVEISQWIKDFFSEIGIDIEEAIKDPDYWPDQSIWELLDEKMEGLDSETGDKMLDELEQFEEHFLNEQVQELAPTGVAEAWAQPMSAPSLTLLPKGEKAKMVEAIVQTMDEALPINKIAAEAAEVADAEPPKQDTAFQYGLQAVKPYEGKITGPIMPPAPPPPPPPPAYTGSWTAPTQAPPEGVQWGANGKIPQLEHSQLNLIVTKKYVVSLSAGLAPKRLGMCRKCGKTAVMPHDPAAIFTEEDAYQLMGAHITSCWPDPPPKKKLTKWCASQGNHHLKCSGNLGPMYSNVTCECDCHQEEFPDEGI